MALFLLLLFVGIPIIEIGVFIKVGGWLGLVPTLALVFLTAIAGTALLRRQGLVTLTRAQQSLNQGVLPVAEVFDGLCLLLAGALLLTPGFVTDAMGLLLFIPAIRHALVASIGRWLVASGRVRATTGADWPGTGGPGGPGGQRGETVVIEGEFEVIKDDPEPPPRGRSVVPPHNP